MNVDGKWRTMLLPEAFWFQEGPGVRNWQFTTSGIKLLNVANIEKDGTLNLQKTNRHLSRLEVAQKYSHFLVDEGDLVIASSGVPFDEDGLLRTRGAFVHAENLPLCLNTSTIRFKAIDGVSDLRFLRLWLNSREFRTQITKRVTGTAQQNFGPSHLKDTRITLPPLDEQRQIADLLDKAEALRAKRRAALAEVDSLAQSIFFEFFGDPASNDRHWPTERMGDLLKIRRGGSPRPIENYLGGDINWIKIGDGTHGSDIYLEHCADKIKKEGLNKTVFLKAGSLIFANCGVSLGFARILKIDGCIHDGWLSFEEVPEGTLDKLFLLKALNSITEHFRRIAPAGTQPNLNTGLMKNFRIILPPITLQREFGSQLMTVEKLKSAQSASLANMDELFLSLQQRAFSGELSPVSR